MSMWSQLLQNCPHNITEDSEFRMMKYWSLFRAKGRKWGFGGLRSCFMIETKSRSKNDQAGRFNYYPILQILRDIDYELYSIMYNR